MLTIILTCTCFKAQGLAQTSFNLQECLTLALANSAQVRAAEKQVKAADYLVKAAWSRYLPKLNFRMESRYFEQESVPLDPEIIKQSPFTPDVTNFLVQFAYPADVRGFSSSFAWQLEQVLLDGGERANNMKLYQTKLALAQLNLRQVGDEISFKVKKLYFNLAKAEIRVQLQKLVIEKDQTAYAILSKKKEFGQVANLVCLDKESELLDSQNVLAELIAVRESLKNQLELAINNDKEINVFTKIKSNFSLPAYDLNQLLAQALANSFALKSDSLESQEKACAANLAQAMGAPRLSFKSNLLYFNPREVQYAQSFTDLKRNGDVGLVFSWPLFDGGESGFKTEAAKLDLARQKELKQQDKYQTLANVKETFLAYQAAKDKLTNTQALEKVRQERAEIRQQQLVIMDELSQDLKQLQEIDWQKAHWDKLLAQYDLLLAQNNLNQSVGGGLDEIKY